MSVPAKVGTNGSTGETVSTNRCWQGGGSFAACCSYKAQAPISGWTQLKSALDNWVSRSTGSIGMQSNGLSSM